MNINNKQTRIRFRIIALLLPILIFVLAASGWSQPTADFEADPLTGYAPLFVTFTDKSTDAVLWTWIISSDSEFHLVLEGQGPHVVKFEMPGIYDVTLEVEDSRGNPDSKTKEGYIHVRAAELDFGDAPDDATRFYRTMDASNGARHLVDNQIYLGALVDVEADGHQSTDAMGDDLDNDDDEDGVIIPLLYQGYTDTLQVTTVGAGLLNAWIDYNGDGDWDEANEWIINNEAFTAGTHFREITVPLDAEPGRWFARFRYGTETLSNYWGYASDGEVEDYAVSIHEAYDWGDAEDPPYPTLAASNGARHKIVPGFHLGYNDVDPEPDGQFGTWPAQGDNQNGINDEDGWLENLTEGYWFSGQQITIKLYASADGMLDAWVDFGINDSWAESEDHIFASEPLSTGNNTLTFTIPQNSNASYLKQNHGFTYFRFRFSSQGGLSFVGPADDGEVEDYGLPLYHADFGDAPQPYPTVMADNGSFAYIYDVYLGYTIDAELDGQPENDALGDDNNDGSDDDDGVFFLPILVGQECDVEVTVSASYDVFLHAWIDFNGNGSWADPGEKIFDALTVSPGLNLLSYDVPATAVEGNTYARFALGKYSYPGQLPEGPIIPGPTFPPMYGEVEDYKVEIQPSSQSTVNDSLILVELYNSTDGPNWTTNTNWLTGPLATWHGVTLTQIPANVWRVTDLQLYFNNLVGTIPASMGNLNQLEVLLLYANTLSGPVPPELGNLSNLTNLELSSNQLTGQIPVELGNLSNLTNLGLTDNQLDGSIPVELGQLSLLTGLALGENNLTGPVPTWLGTQLTQLEALYLYDNQLTGPIPAELGNLTNLTELSLRINMLDGSIPVELGNLSQLEWLNIRNNQLSGQIPQQLGNLSNLQLFRCDNNQLNGQIPNQLGNMSSLTTFRVDFNQLSGAIPGSIQNLTTLVNMRLNDNQFTDLPDLSPLVNLMNLTAENNQFTFEDIEPNVGVPSNSFTYSPQADVGTVQDETINVGDNLTLTVTVGGTSNHYQWMKDNVDIPGAVSSSYDIVSAQASDAGIYVCKITNAIATALTLTSKPITVTVLGTGIEEKAVGLPETMALYQNYPNPFNPGTTIRYQTPQPAEVALTIYDVNGKVVRRLVQDVIPAGYHSASWNGTDESGKAVASGMYFYRIDIKTIGAKQSSYVAVKRLILMK